MRLSAVALDYDGTIARHDVLDPAVREAIAAVRAQGTVVLLVTGRILSELRRVAGDLHFVDGVVAENGAVLHLTDSGHGSRLAPPVPPAFLAELTRRGIPHVAGESLVDADATLGPRILDVIRTLQLPLVLLYNGGRVMTLAQGVSKATGLRTALNMLRLSPRGTVAIGDAENDHELLRLAEVGVAVGWGSPALKAAADIVLAGESPAAVATYLRDLAATGHLPLVPRARRRLLLGHTEDGREFSLAVRGRNVLLSGDAKSGKSWIAGLLCEQLILHGYCVCIVDPEGDYRPLEALPGVEVLGGDDPPPTPRQIQSALRYPDRSVVIDLSRLALDEKIEYSRAVLRSLNELRRRTGLPHRIVVDEAHYFLHDETPNRFLDLEHNGYTFVTYWPSRLPQELLAATEVMLVTRESNPAEVEALRRWCPACDPADGTPWELLGRLRLGQAVALPITEEAGGRLQLFNIAPRLTPHVRHRGKYVDVPVSESKGFGFFPPGYPGCRATTMRQFVLALERLPPQALEPYVRRGDFSRWIGEVFGDYPLAAELRAIEQRHRERPRTETIHDMTGAVRARYDLMSESAPRSRAASDGRTARP